MTAGQRFVFLLLALFALGAFARHALADVVTLDNGDRITGRILHKGGDTLTLQTGYAGRLSLAWARVAGIATDGAVDVLLEGARHPKASRLRPSGGGRIALDAAETSLTRIAYINPTPAESGTGTVYSGNASLSSANAYGNSASSRLNAQGEVSARTRTRRYTLGLKTERASDAGRETASNWLGNASVDQFIDARRFYYGRGSLEKNRYADLRLRSSVGGGYGLQFFETERTKLSLRGGLDLVSVNRIAGVDESYPAAGWGLRFSHRLERFALELFHEQDGYLGLRDSRNLSVRSRSGLRLPIAGGLTASVQANVDWERTPAPGRKPTDTTLLVGMGYRW